MLFFTSHFENNIMSEEPDDNIFIGKMAISLLHVQANLLNNAELDRLTTHHYYKTTVAQMRYDLEIID